MPPDVVATVPRIDPLYLNVSSIPVSEVDCHPAWTACDTDSGNGRCPGGSIDARVDVHTIPVTTSVSSDVDSSLLYVLDAPNIRDDPVEFIDVVGPISDDVTIDK